MLLNKIFVRFIWLTKECVLYIIINYYYLPHHKFLALLTITVRPATFWWKIETCMSLRTESVLVT